MRTVDADVIVVGAGPVGLAAAIRARLHGFDTLLIDRRTGIIDKACGEGLLPGAVVELAALGVHPHGYAITGIDYIQGARRAEHAFPTGTGMGVRRTALHAVLAARADAVGVRRLHGTLRALRNEPDHVAVQVTDHRQPSTLRARWVLGCDGLHSTVREQAGLAGRPQARRHQRYGIRQHFHVAPWSNHVQVYWAPHAEAYVTPVSQDTVDVAILGRRPLSLPETLESLPPLTDQLKDAHPASALLGAGPFSQRSRARTHGRVLLLGDAAAYTDALTGEGIRVGLDDAEHAVTAIATGNPAGYEARWRRNTRGISTLTAALVFAARSPLRRAIVPTAASIPSLYAAGVNHLAT